MRLKNWVLSIAALCGFFIAQNSQAVCTNYTDYTDGQVLTASSLDGLQTNYTNCINGILDGDIFTGNVNLYSGADLNMYSDTGTTLKFTVDGATGAFGIPSGQKFYLDGTALTGDTYFREVSANNAQLVVGGSTAFQASSTLFAIGADLSVNAANKLYLDGGGNTYIQEISSDLIQFVAGGSGSFYVGNNYAAVDSTDKFYFDGGGDTYDTESSANVLDRYVGGVLGFRLDATADPLFPSHDTTASGANAYLDSATGELMRSTSSIKYKENVEDLEIDTAKIYELRAVSYDDKQENAKEVEDTSLTHKRYFGLIAEEVDKLIPQLVDHNSVTGDPEYVFYDRLSVLLLKEVQKLKAENDDIKARLLAAGM